MATHMARPLTMGCMLRYIIPLCDVPWSASVESVDADVGGEVFLI